MHTHTHTHAHTCSTRELAVQIEAEAIKFGKASGIVSGCVYGGMPKGPQIRVCMMGLHVLIGTPGELSTAYSCACTCLCYAYRCTRENSFMQSVYGDNHVIYLLQKMLAFIRILDHWDLACVKKHEKIKPWVSRYKEVCWCKRLLDTHSRVMYTQVYIQRLGYSKYTRCVLYNSTYARYSRKVLFQVLSCYLFISFIPSTLI